MPAVITFHAYGCLPELNDDVKYDTLELLRDPEHLRENLELQ